jgi:hypothetical protein
MHAGLVEVAVVDLLYEGKAVEGPSLRVVPKVQPTIAVPKVARRPIVLAKGVAKVPSSLDFEAQVVAENFLLSRALLNETLANRGPWFEIHL